MCGSTCMSSSVCINPTCDRYSGIIESCQSCTTGSWGTPCEYVCPCSNPACNQYTGALVSCDSCTAGYYGKLCGSTCSSAWPCGTPTCDRNSSAMVSCGRCATEYWVPCANTRARTRLLVSKSELWYCCFLRKLCCWLLGNSVRIRVLKLDVQQFDMQSAFWTRCFLRELCCWLLGYDVRIDVLGCFSPTCCQSDGAVVSCAICVAGYWGVDCSSQCAIDTKTMHCASAASATCEQSNGTLMSCGGTCANGFNGTIYSSVASGAESVRTISIASFVMIGMSLAAAGLVAVFFCPKGHARTDAIVPTRHEHHKSFQKYS